MGNLAIKCSKCPILLFSEKNAPHTTIFFGRVLAYSQGLTFGMWFLVVVPRKGSSLHDFAVHLTFLGTCVLKFCSTHVVFQKNLVGNLTKNKRYCKPTFRCIHPLSDVSPLFTRGTPEYTC